MKHPHEKFIRIELFSLVLTMILFIFAVIKGFTFFAFISLLLITISLLADAIILWGIHEKAPAIKQVVRAILILFLTIYILLKL